jgi:hypothetical protein
MLFARRTGFPKIKPWAGPVILGVGVAMDLFEGVEDLRLSESTPPTATLGIDEWLRKEATRHDRTKVTTITSIATHYWLILGRSSMRL